MGSRNGYPAPFPPGAAPQFSRPVPTPIRKDIDSLTERVEQLEREKAALESFAAVAAHEMIEPLVITESYAAMLAERLDPKDAESGQAVEMVCRSTARARLLVETLLHDARAADRQLQLEDVDLERTVTDCLELLAPEVKARGARIVVGDLPRVRGEAVMLGSVLSNLLVNAMKYSPRQQPQIVVGATRAGRAWTISVTSSGPTIAVEDRERIFAEFTRARVERRVRGAGLGLAICRRIVERHGGTIGVTAANGSGNRFYFTVPAA